MTLSYNSYQRFTTIIMQNHESDALRTAQTALTFLDADNFSVYELNASARQELLRVWQRIFDIQDVMFIYVIKPFSGYKDIRFGVNVKITNSDYDYDIISFGYVKPTSRGDHVSAMITIKMLMFFIGRQYLKSKLLNPLSALTQGVKEISASNLDKKLDV